MESIKPVSYYGTDETLEALCSEFGDTFEHLTVAEKLTLLSIITQFLSAISDCTVTYDLSLAADDSPLELTDAITDFLDVLNECRNEFTLKIVIKALAAQIDAAPIVFDESQYESAKETLLDNGVSAEIAEHAARVIGHDHAALERSEAQQRWVTRAWEQINLGDLSDTEARELELDLAP